MSQTKNELTLKRLKSKYAIEHLFTEGEVLRTRHLIFRLAKKEEGNAFYAGVSVAKRNFKNAVDRNKIKRQLRVAIKTHKHLFSFPGYGMLIFKGTKALTTPAIIEEADSLFKKF